MENHIYKNMKDTIYIKAMIVKVRKKLAQTVLNKNNNKMDKTQTKENKSRRRGQQMELKC